jgi:geranylgeranyl diphosphate synthase type I
MKTFFEQQKQLITAYLRTALQPADADELESRVGRVDAAARQTLLEFCLRGKMLRGGLVRLGFNLFRTGDDETVTACGAALELFQSALLIHDDIMDRDAVRRGRRTLHTLYRDTARAAGVQDPEHSGLSLGICVGDIGFFLGFHILSALPRSGAQLSEIVSLVAREMSLVGAAQMLDVSAETADPAGAPGDEEEILTLYRYKTGRYTFSLPLSLGALLAGRENEVRRALEAVGERLGIIFQIKDDELGLFADNRQTGKPAGSDIREGKRTIYFTRLAPTLTKPEAERFQALQGTADLTRSDIEFVRRLVTEHGIADHVNNTVDRLADDCRNMINTLRDRFRLQPEPLTGLLEYSLTRQS